MGVGMLHLFALEHNAVCDALKKVYPQFDDQRLFELAVLTVSGLIAKIHGVEWTPNILRHHPPLSSDSRPLGTACSARSSSPMGQVATSETLSGTKRIADRSLLQPVLAGTEEFVSVYRMHPLIPDDWNFFARERRASAEPQLHRAAGPLHPRLHGQIWRWRICGTHSVWPAPARGVLAQLPERAASADSHRRSDHRPGNPGHHCRDRERGVPRYNDFREALGCRVVRPSRRHPNAEWAREINEVYNGDVDAVDLQIGMQAEQPVKGNGFSDTATRDLRADGSAQIEERPLLHQRSAARGVHPGRLRLGL